MHENAGYKIIECFGLERTPEIIQPQFEVKVSIQISCAVTFYTSVVNQLW